MAANSYVFVCYVVLHTLPLLLLTLSGGEACSGNTCSDCLTSGAECAWCADVNFTSIVGERCGLEGTLRESGCDNVQNPKTREDIAHRVDEPVEDGNTEAGREAIQLQPQAMRIKVRPRGKGHEFWVTFRPANDFPVDLYFLFDLSSTMKEYIKDFANLAHKIAEEISQISVNYRMGYGTFQDKVVLPFTNTHPAKLKNPCPKNNFCAPPFDYRHELSLTKDINVFTTAVDWSTGNTTGNIDRPEGGFDAMMQAIVCKTLGWRDNSRQLIILASDARMHFAGDGKLGGLITPNDGNCHLDDGRTNSMSKIQDYPSVGQIAEALDRTKKYVIFAVVGEVVEEYRKLISRFERFSVDELKGGNDSNVVAIVRDKYREMTKGVKLEATPSNPDLIKVSITPTCKHTDGVSCTKLNIGKTVNPFKVQIRAEECPQNPKDRIQHVLIAPSDFLKDTLNVTVEIICDCDCELDSDDPMVPSSQCSDGNGTMECGICHCFGGRSGALCECGQQDGASSGLEGSCSEEGRNSTQGPECSGLGQCVCGVCQCPPDYSGRYCQCNNKVCPTFDGLVCAGNGECRCEECYCTANYTGHACQCPLSNEACTEEGDDEICSGHGSCQCGQCVCDNGYLGSRCQTCFSCGDSVCEDDETYNYRQCAVCVVTSEQTCPDDCPEVIEVEEVIMEDDRADAQREVCRDYLTDDCHIRFAVYNPGTVNTTLHVQRSKVCTEGPDILLIVLGVVGGVVGVGLILLLLVKLLTTLFDRLEYQHFLKELQSPKWAKHNNPIYKEATTTYYNPVMSRD